AFFRHAARDAGLDCGGLGNVGAPADDVAKPDPGHAPRVEPRSVGRIEFDQATEVGDRLPESPGPEMQQRARDQELTLRRSQLERPVDAPEGLRPVALAAVGEVAAVVRLRVRWI